MSAPRVDRRGLIALGLAAGTGLALPGAGLTRTLPSDQRQLLMVLFETELLAIATVERVLASPHLHRRARALTRRVLSAEHAHAAALDRALRGLGAGGRSSAPSGPAEIDRALAARHIHRSVTGLHTEHNCLDLLLDLEAMAEGMYYAAMPNLSDPSLRRMAAGLLAGEAQHEALLGLLRDPKDFNRAAPYAFVEGTGP